MFISGQDFIILKNEENIRRPRKNYLTLHKSVQRVWHSKAMSKVEKLAQHPSLRAIAKMDFATYLGLHGYCG